MLTRVDFRRKMRYKRDSLSEAEREAESLAIERILTSSDIWLNAQSVFIYYSIDSEVATHGIIDAALKSGKAVYLPRCAEQGEMHAIRIMSLDDLKPGKYFIPEPVGTDELMGAPDLTIVPGLAFDSYGGRMGYGGGYYDRFLANVNTTAAALAYTRQVIERVPTGAHDAPVNYIITPAGIIACDERA